MLERYINTILQYRWPVIALVAITTFAAGGGAQYLTVANDYRILFGPNNQQYLAYQALKETYASSDTVVIAMTPNEGSAFTPEVLSALDEMTEAGWQVPYSTRVSSLTNHMHSEAFGDELNVAPLVGDVDSLTPEDLSRIQNIALNEEELVGHLVAKDGRTLGMIISFILPEVQDTAVIEVGGYADDMLAQAREKYPNINFYMTGSIILNRAFGSATEENFSVLVPMTLLLIIVMAMVILRSFFGAFSLVAVLLFVLMTAMGSGGWYGTVFSPTNAAIPIIIMVIAIADSIHIISGALRGMRRGRSRQEAIMDSVCLNAQPVFYTSVTTAIGFLALNASESPPFQVLGNFVAFGILCAFVYSMTLLPALLSILPLRPPRVREGKTEFFVWFSDFVIARRSLLLLSTGVLTLVLVSGIWHIDLGNKLVESFDESYEVRRDSDYILANLTGLDTLEYSLHSGEESGVVEPEYLRKADIFANWFREQPEVLHVKGLPDTMKRLNKNMHGDDPDYHRLPEDRELAAQYLLLYELSLPLGADLNDRIDIGKTSSRMTVTVKNISSRELQELEQRAQDWLQVNMPDLAGDATGVSVIMAHIAERNMSSMLGSAALGMVLISLILVGIFRSLLLGAISLIPNLLPALMAFGLWGYAFGNIGLTASVVVAVVFGLIVDDTIHFLSKYDRGRRKGETPSESVRYAFTTVGQALWTTTAVLTAGFLVLTLSGFAASWVLGSMVAMTVVFALFTDFLLLPGLLSFLDRRKASSASPQPSST